MMLASFILFTLLCTPISGFITYASLKGRPYNVTYDRRSFFLNGDRVLLLGGSVHYPRSTPAMWPSLFELAVENGLNTIETYVFWNLHEQERGIYDFSGRGDLIQFINQAAAHNLFVNLRIGPFVGGEWFYGGFPIWLKYIPGMEMRAFNKPFMTEMATFMKYITDLVEPYLPSNGGNVIMAQVENEYNGGDMQYVNWCGNFAQSLDIHIPWIMCNGRYANNTILTCNGCDCDQWVQSHWDAQPNMPGGWTENEGWYDQWGKANLIRNPSDLAYSVATFVAAGGSFQNYYMWHGGNNYGWTSAASVTTMYANDVMVDSMALPHEPKFSFLGSLHKLLQSYADVILSQNPPTPQKVNNSVNAINYQKICFLVNSGAGSEAHYSGNSYYLPEQSALILSSNGAVLFNTSDVSSSSIPHTVTIAQNDLKWVSWTEPTGISLPEIYHNQVPLDQLQVSGYGDYMWYSTTVNFTSQRASMINITSSVSQSYSVFVNGQYRGSNWDYTKSSDILVIPISISTPITQSSFKLDILCGSLGVDSNGVEAQTFVKGIAGDVFVGSQNITLSNWVMQGSLVGEALETYMPSNEDLVSWSDELPAPNTPMVWYATNFTTPKHNGTVALDVTGAGKGIAYVNGNSLGRYWTLPGYCEGITWCAYYGSNCTTPTQFRYHIPPDWMNEDVNTLVLFEELGAANIETVSIVVLS